MSQEQVLSAFAEAFGGADGAEVFFSPGRVNLIGEHTDYNGGHVFPCALTLGTFGAARRRDDDWLRFYSANFPGTGIIECRLSELSGRPDLGWANYPLGVVWALAEKGYLVPSGFELAIYGTIPNGSGLSSSASLEVLTGVAVQELFGFTGLSMVDLALAGQKAENEYCGCSCGIMDQYAAACGQAGHAMFLDAATLECRQAPLALSGMKIVVTNSCVKHSLVSSAYNDRRAECASALSDLQRVLDVETLGDLDNETFDRMAGHIESIVCRHRARHAVYENNRCKEAVAALEAGDVVSFGRLMNASHTSLRDDFEVSCPEIDALVEEAQALPGVLGSRITGGGFGGCTVSIVEDGALETFKTALSVRYRRDFDRTPEFYVVEIGDGARKLS